MPVPFENACALQSLYKLTKQNCNFDETLVHLQRGFTFCRIYEAI